MEKENFYDVVVIGGGPAGLTAALYLARARYRVLILEKEKFGGQVTITDEVVNYPGIEKTSGRALTETMRRQAEFFGAEFLLREVTALKKEETASGAELWESTTDKDSFQSFGILLATGAHPRMIGFPGEAEFRGHGVAYCATCDGAFFKNKVTAVVGGGDVAVEDALYLSRMCGKVYLIHRRDEFRAAKSLVKKARETDNIEFVLDSVVEKIDGENKVRSINIRSKKGATIKTLEVDGVFFAVGMQPVTAFVDKNIEMNEAGYIIAGEDCATNIPGVYAAGDIRTKQLRQIITAAADGANAVTSVEKYIG